LLSDANDDERRAEADYWLWLSKIAHNHGRRSEALRLYTESYAPPPGHVYRRKIDQMWASGKNPLSAGKKSLKI